MFSVALSTTNDGIAILKISGRVTLGSESVEIESTITRLVAEGTRKLVFDIAEVTYIDSAGMGQVAFAASKLGQVGGQCRVAGAKGLVLDVFRITRIDSIVPFHATVEEACAAFGA